MQRACVAHRRAPAGARRRQPRRGSRRRSPNPPRVAGQHEGVGRPQCRPCLARSPPIRRGASARAAPRACRCYATSPRAGGVCRSRPRACVARARAPRSRAASCPTWGSRARACALGRGSGAPPAPPAPARPPERHSRPLPNPSSTHRRNLRPRAFPPRPCCGVHTAARPRRPRGGACPFARRRRPLGGQRFELSRSRASIKPHPTPSKTLRTPARHRAPAGGCALGDVRHDHGLFEGSFPRCIGSFRG